MNICIYGGSFNPPHKMHKKIVDKMLQEDIDKVIIVPTGNAYNKLGLIDIKHRISMLELVFKGTQSVQISDFEDKSQQIFTYQTYMHFKEIYPQDKIFIVMGSDNIKTIKSWKNADYLIKNCNFLVFLRNNDDPIDILQHTGGANIIFKKDVGECSSSKIRKFLSNNKSIDRFVKTDVIEYIKKHNLYGEIYED